jgi:hypothetical protein
MGWMRRSAGTPHPDVSTGIGCSKMGNWRCRTKNTRPGRKRDFRDGRKVMRLEYASSARSSERQRGNPTTRHAGCNMANENPPDGLGIIERALAWSKTRRLVQERRNRILSPDSGARKWGKLPSSDEKPGADRPPTCQPAIHAHPGGPPGLTAGHPMKEAAN